MIRQGLLFAASTCLFSLVTACADSAVDEPDNAAQGTIAGTRLAEIAVDDATTVGFYELAPGVVGVRESAALDRADDRAFHSPLAAIGAKATLADTYRALAPGQAVPAAILAADARVAELAPKLAAQAAVHADTDAASLDRSDRTGDLLHDNYGAQWFLDRYCVEGGSRYCPTNVGWAYSGRSQSKWFKTCAMAADFEAGTQFKGGHRFQACSGPFGIGCDWYTQLDWDYIVMARHVECWTYNNPGTGTESWSYGQQPAPRTHLSALRLY